MIAETIVLGVVIITTASLQFAKWVTREERESGPEAKHRRAIEEKRRVLERDRAEWFACLEGPSVKNATENMKRIDRELLKLADEEASI